MKTPHPSCLFNLSSGIALLLVSASVFAMPTTNGNVIEVPDDGWYQVQRADNYESICEGQLRCEVTPGDYIVINHTSGERFNINVGDSPTTDPVTEVSVSGNLIQWPDDGWYQVQDSSTYVSLCEGGSSCEVANGEYIVINHSTGNRQTVTVGHADSNTFVTVVDNTIQMRDDGWYQVQNATTYEPVCEGERSCTVANGNYIVINHTTGERDDNVIVDGESDIINPVITPPMFDLVAPQIMPARCIGSLDSDNTRFCVDPETRLFSATKEDGSLHWSYTLPGANDTNQIETVLTTDQWLIIVADRYPELDQLTLEQRSNQYEASLFNKNGSFVRTVPLTIDLRINDTPETDFVNSRFSSGALNNPLPAIATESNAGNPLLVIGWNRWRSTDRANTNWDHGGVSVFDLASGVLLRNNIYVQNGISELSLLKGERDIVRIVSDLSTTWKYIDDLNFVHPSYFAQFAQDATIAPSGNVDSQINAGNYQEIIARVLPWINGDVANRLMFGSVSDEPPRGFPIPYDNFTLLSQFDDDNYTYTNFQCFEDGEVLRRTHRFVSISMSVFDQCEFDNKTLSGKLIGNYVGRDGFGVRAENLTTHGNDNSATTANLGHSVSYTRVGSGSYRSFFGSMAGYGESAEGKNISVANYSSSADFFYGPSIGGEVCGAEYSSSGGQPITQLNCKRYRAEGSIRGSLWLNADWTSYGTLFVNTDLNFGQDYHYDFSWTSTNGTSLPDPIPYDGPTEPLKDFYFSSGSIRINAQDQSRIELTPIAQPGEPAFNVKVYDPDGNELGNFPSEFLNVKCVERLGICVVP